MTIPDFQTMMRPVLAHLADGAIRQSRQVKEDMAQAYSLTQEERDRLLPSGKQRVMDNRVSWALSYLVQAGLVERIGDDHIFETLPTAVLAYVAYYEAEHGEPPPGVVPPDPPEQPLIQS